MTSDLTPEYAYRGTDSGVRNWRLSWLGDRPLTVEQARAGLELDELISNPALIDEPVAHAAIAERSEVLGLDWRDAVRMLARGMLARCDGGPEDPAPSADMVGPGLSAR
ncbi:hypothetical protein [Nocardia arizonensis]|uniref:hypothetical protein n=1 Tax=Nocardia arizonensis TaxID=1141647 RepID=UPI0006D1805E|nr:hypothetical protein [Nocardia arizonensis]